MNIFCPENLVYKDNEKQIFLRKIPYRRITQYACKCNDCGEVLYVQKYRLKNIMRCKPCSYKFRRGKKINLKLTDAEKKRKSEIFKKAWRDGKCDKKRNPDAALNGLMLAYINGSRKRKIEFALTKEEFKEITKRNCYYCGDVPNNEARRENKKLVHSYIYNGIDRLDNDKGYTLNNSVACCKKCNFMKGKMSEIEFLENVRKIYEFKIKTLDISSD